MCAHTTSYAIMQTKQPQQKPARMCWPLATVDASFLKLLGFSVPGWFKIPGSISAVCFISAWPVMANVLAAGEAWTLGLLKWITRPSSLIMFTSSVPGVELTDSFFFFFLIQKKKKRILRILVVCVCCSVDDPVLSSSRTLATCPNLVFLGLQLQQFFWFHFGWIVSGLQRFLDLVTYEVKAMASPMEWKVTSSCLSVPSPTSVQKLALGQYFALVKVAFFVFFFFFACRCKYLFILYVFGPTCVFALQN